jgi:hypothetical protein
MALTPEQEKEIAEVFAASYARNEAIERRWRFEAGEFSVELVRAVDDPPVNDPAFQTELSQFGASLRTAGIPYSQRAMAFDSVDALGYPLPEFIFAIKDIATPLIGALGVVAGAFVQAKYGRKVRLKIGDDEAEARNVAELEELWKIAAKYRDPDPKGTPELQHRLDLLRKKESEIEAELKKIQPLTSLSRLNDELLAVRKEIERLQ